MVWRGLVLSAASVKQTKTHLAFVSVEVTKLVLIRTSLVLKDRTWHLNYFLFSRLVLGFYLSEPSSGSSPVQVWRDIPGAGQQPPSVHAGPFSKDPLWAHQRAHRVQQRQLLAGLHVASVASPTSIPRRSEPRPALHRLRPDGAGPGVRPAPNQAGPSAARG